jgi:PTH1 family peptidyl-tRNA hydrolase
VTWLIVGLGNPGPTYANTRHNVGYLVADVLAERIGGNFKAHASRRADVVEGRLADQRVVIGRARSFMNESGGAVSTLAKYYDVDAERVVAIHDEIDIGLGQLRVKFGGGDNGHNGLKSLRKSLDTGDFFRVRVGVGRPSGSGEVHDHVLKSFNAAERKELPFLMVEAADAVESLISKGLEPTQAAFNR